MTGNVNSVNSDANTSYDASLHTIAGTNSLNNRRKRQKPWFFCITVVASAVILSAASCWVIILIEDSEGPGYNQKRAIMFAQLAGAAYCSEDTVTHWKCGTHCLVGMRAVRFCNGSRTKAYVGLWENRPFVSIRGSRPSETESLESSLRKLENTTRWDVCENCSVNSEVLEEWAILEKCIEESIVLADKQPHTEIRVTGHSFGAAVSAVALLALRAKGWTIEESYNFGMPRTGNIYFSRAIQEAFENRVFRVTHGRDPLVHVPKPKHHYSHIEPEWFYNQEVIKGFKRCAKDEPDNICSGQYSTLFDDIKHVEHVKDHIKDHWNYLDIALGSGCDLSHEIIPLLRSKSRPDAIATV